MRLADPPVHYLVGTPKGRLTKLEKDLVKLPWEDVRQGIEVKLLPKNEELYVLAQSHDRVLKERAIRRRKLKRLWARLKEISAMELNRDELLMKLGAARAKGPAAWRLVDVEVASEGVELQLRPQPQETQKCASPRRSLSAANQSEWQRSGPAVAALYSTH